jgi:hypothetical protein
MQPHAAAYSTSSTPLADFRESRDGRRADSKEKLWARLKGGSGAHSSSLLVDVASETGPEGVILPLIGRKRNTTSSTSSSNVSSLGSGSDIWPSRSATHLTQGSALSASASAIARSETSIANAGSQGDAAMRAFHRAAVGRGGETREEAGEAFRRTLDSSTPASLVDDRRRKWSFMSPSGTGSGSAIPVRERETVRKKSGSIIGGLIGVASAPPDDGQRGGRKGSWKLKNAAEVTAISISSAPNAPLSSLGTHVVVVVVVVVVVAVAVAVVVSLVSW